MATPIAQTGKELQVTSRRRRKRLAPVPRPQSLAGSYERRLQLAGVVGAGVAVAFAIQYPLLPWADELTDQGKITGYHGAALLAFVVGLAAWFASYIVILGRARGLSWRSFPRVGYASILIQLGAMAVMYPTNAIDVYIYAARSHLWSRWGANPNAVEPIHYWEQDSFVRYASEQWADEVSPYGPLWNHFAWPITKLADGDIVVALLGFKVLAIVCVAVTALCVHEIVRATDPDRAMQATLVWTLNPLVLWEGVGNGHNDLLIAAIVLAALLAWVRGRLGWVLPLLAASILVKYVTVVLVPLAVVAIWGRLRHLSAFVETMLISAGVIGLMLVASLAPFTDLPAILRSIEDQGARISRSPLGMAIATARQLDVHGEVFNDVLLAGAWIVVMIVLGGALHRAWRDPAEIPWAWFDVLFVMLIVATANLRPWYVIWLVGIAAVLPVGFPTLRTITWSASGLLAYCHYIWGNTYLDLPRYWYDLAGVAIALVPVVAVMIWEYSAARGRAPDLETIAGRLRHDSPR